MLTLPWWLRPWKTARKHQAAYLALRHSVNKLPTFRIRCEGGEADGVVRRVSPLSNHIMFPRGRHSADHESGQSAGTNFRRETVEYAIDWERLVATPC
jgi:hypothetical protein